MIWPEWTAATWFAVGTIWLVLTLPLPTLWDWWKDRPSGVTVRAACRKQWSHFWWAVKATALIALLILLLAGARMLYAGFARMLGGLA